MAKSAAAKLFVSVPGDLARTVRKTVGTRGVSGFVARAMRHELERHQLASFVAELDQELGPVDEDIVREAREVWQRR